MGCGVPMGVGNANNLTCLERLKNAGMGSLGLAGDCATPRIDRGTESSTANTIGVVNRHPI
jgi:hypothetical protein